MAQKQQNKTQPTSEDVLRFVDGVANERRREDTRQVIELMAAITGEPPRLWGTSIVGFGQYHYVYESGREGDMFLTGVSPRKQALTLYIVSGFTRYDDLLARLGKHKIGKSCLYVNKLADIDLPTLEELISLSVAHLREKYQV